MFVLVKKMAEVRLALKKLFRNDSQKHRAHNKQNVLPRQINSMTLASHKQPNFTRKGLNILKGKGDDLRQNE